LEKKGKKEGGKSEKDKQNRKSEKDRKIRKVRAAMHQVLLVEVSTLENSLELVGGP